MPCQIVAALVALGACGAVAGAPALIIDTDMSTDVDDVAAVCMAHALADRNEVELLAVVHNTGLLNGVGAISVINHWYGRDHLPIGAFKGEFGATLPGKYVESIVQSFPSPVKNYTQVPGAVKVYRSVLATQPDRSVTISSIGFMTNLRALLASPPDGYSPLSGVALVAQKVQRLVWMGGSYPDSGSKYEWNFGGGGPNYAHSTTSSEATNFTLAHLPAEVEVVFSGNEVGGHIRTGGNFSTCASTSNPCRQAFLDYGVGPGGHASFDPATTLMGVRGVQSGCVPAPYNVSGAGGHNTVDPVTGINKWVLGAASNQTYVEFATSAGDASAKQVGAAIDALLCRPPRALQL